MEGSVIYYVLSLSTTEKTRKHSTIKELSGVWLSLARAPGLGPGSRRFESCHPDLKETGGDKTCLVSLYCLRV